MEDKFSRMVGDVLQQATLFGIEMCREAVTKLRDKASAELPDHGYHYVEGLNDALEMIETVHHTSLEIAIREKAKHDEQTSRKQ